MTRVVWVPIIVVKFCTLKNDSGARMLNTTMTMTQAMMRAKAST